MINKGDLVRVGLSCLNQTIVGKVGLVMYVDRRQVLPAKVFFKMGPYHFHDTHCLEVLSESR